MHECACTRGQNRLAAAPQVFKARKGRLAGAHSRRLRLQPWLRAVIVSLSTSSSRPRVRGEARRSSRVAGAPPPPGMAGVAAVSARAPAVLCATGEAAWIVSAGLWSAVAAARVGISSATGPSPARCAARNASKVPAAGEAGGLGDVASTLRSKDRPLMGPVCSAGGGPVVRGDGDLGVPRAAEGDMGCPRRLRVGLRAVTRP